MSVTSLATIIVPARLASVRFPRKLLADVGGKPLILRTAERLRTEVPEYEVFYAVDSEELARPLKGGGFSVVMTDPDLPSGTDRIAQANLSLRRETILNVQADEPMVERDQVLSLNEALKKEKAVMSTLAAPFRTEKDFCDPNQVKIVLDKKGYALYFSRSPIPCLRDKVETENEPNCWGMKHLGMYGYDSSFLETFSRLPPSRLERIEKLEQLRVLENGYSIGVAVVDRATIGVDVPSDLKKLSLDCT